MMEMSTSSTQHMYFRGTRQRQSTLTTRNEKNSTPRALFVHQQRKGSRDHYGEASSVKFSLKRRKASRKRLNSRSGRDHQNPPTLPVVRLTLAWLARHEKMFKIETHPSFHRSCLNWASYS
mmetsp:Transcript_18826/g.29921  ORF Transcript_18826/g.29921 Transcript_18826/m.29921 type:complete len:121 (-) Transcript_18826:501-863(-)